MPSFLKRLISGTYRRALGAEAAGDYLGAAEAYGLAGMPAKVAEMHLVRAGRLDPPRRGEALADALRWLRKIDDEDYPEAVSDELAKSLLDEAKALPEGDPRRRRGAVEAAKLYERTGKMREAGAAHELAGQRDEAARCYEAAGDIEGMERLLEEDSQGRRSSRAASDAFDEYEVAMAAGARDRASDALRRACAAAPGQGYDRMLQDLERRLPRHGNLEIRLDGLRWLLAGAFPAYLGRGDAHLRLRHPGISRRHAAIDLEGEGFALRDAGSRNGTLLSGIALAGRVPLQGSGVIGLGQDCNLQYAALGSNLELEVLDGPDRGLKAVLLRQRWSPPRSSLEFSFDNGLARLRDASGAALELNDKLVTTPIVPLQGDRIESPAGERVEVL